MSQFTLPVCPPTPKGVTDVDKVSGALLDVGEKLVNAVVPGLGTAIHDVRKALGPQNDSSVLGAVIGGLAGGLPGAVRGAHIGSKY